MQHGSLAYLHGHLLQGLHIYASMKALKHYVLINRRRARTTHDQLLPQAPRNAAPSRCKDSDIDKPTHSRTSRVKNLDPERSFCYTSQVLEVGNLLLEGNHYVSGRLASFATAELFIRLSHKATRRRTNRTLHPPSRVAVKNYRETTCTNHFGSATKSL